MIAITHFCSSKYTHFIPFQIILDALAYFLAERAYACRSVLLYLQKGTK
jgi:hypothetical protein